MTERTVDMDASATLFEGSDLDAQIARLPCVHRRFRHYDKARDAVIAACEKLGARQEGAFLVQRNQRVGIDQLKAIYRTAPVQSLL